MTNMIYPENFEEKLGFDQIREKLKSMCLSQAGASRVAQMRFSSDPTFIRVLLRQTLEFRLILEKGENFPSRHYFDGEEWLSKIALEGDYLDAPDFLSLSYALGTILEARTFLSAKRELYPELHNLAISLSVTSAVPDAVHNKIDDKGLVRDSASPELNSIRKKLRDEQNRLRRLTDQLYRQAVEQKWVPEGALPTIRDGRLVIPILAEHKRKLKGFILDESATGQTVFMEPAEMLDSNNEIRDLEHAEKREIIRILRALTDVCRAHLPDLIHAFQFLGQIDFIRAKARFAIEVNGEMPVIETKPRLTWYQARHPLLYLSLRGKREVVPLDIDLDDVNRMLLVSGPNAVGKSVCLKTVGLLQYMVQSGLLAPLSERSHVGVFHGIFLDIGDQQSIENDLSTYSSHLRNMNTFIQHAGASSLVLLDELGSGTDPNFGGSIAEAVLDELVNKKVWGVATTHYYNLKLYAGQHQGIRNAAMRFDDKNLVPLFVLDIGKPGSSFALEIARKTGLPRRTLERAEQLVGKDLAGFEKLVRNLERERQELNEKVKRLEKQESELKQSLSKYQHLSQELETKKKDILLKAKEEAALLLKNTNKEIEKTIRHIRENKAEKKETLRVRKSLETIKQQVVPSAQAAAKTKDVIEEGDRVRLIGQEGSGVVISLKGKQAMVQFGELKSLVDVTKLEKTTGGIDREVRTRLRSVGLNIYEKQARFSSSLDVRGKRVEEVIPLVEQFMDTAILLSQSELRILHGKGEGVLRKVIREQLRKYKEVASVADEHVERGGDGITIVVLK